MQETANGNPSNQQPLLATELTSNQSSPAMTNAVNLPIPPRPSIYSRLASRYKDTLRIKMADARQEYNKITVVKATKTDLLAPKENHVRSILVGLRWGGSMESRAKWAGNIAYHLRKRLFSSQGVVVAKVLAIMHHVLRKLDGDFPQFLANLFSDQSVRLFVPGGVQDEHWEYFVRPYFAYLGQWLRMKVNINFPNIENIFFRTHKDNSRLLHHFVDCNRDKFVADIPVLMDTKYANLQCPRTNQQPWLTVMEPAFTMLDKDLTLFIFALQYGLLKHVIAFHSLQKPHTQRIYNIYKRYLRIIVRIAKLFQDPSTLETEDTVPKMRLDIVPLDLEAEMIKHIRSTPKEIEERRFSLL